MISVIVCTHNPREDYLVRALRALQAQTLPKTQWELLVIDNASTNALCDTLDLSWHPSAKVIREERLGLTFARLRGIAESIGDYLVFVDDDNCLKETYLATAQAILEDHSFLGVIGGTCEAEFEVPVPKWADWGLECLGIRKAGHGNRPTWALSPRPGPYTPIGAGMVIRRFLAERYAQEAESDPFITKMDRRGASLMGAGDTEMALVATDFGLGQGTFPELELKHLISAGRLNLDYLKRMYYGLDYSTTLLKLRKGLMKPRLSRYPRWVSIWMHSWRRGLVFSEKGQLIRCAMRGRLDAIRDFLGAGGRA